MSLTFIQRIIYWKAYEFQQIEASKTINLNSAPVTVRVHFIRHFHDI
jgi:hypothetical protein